MNNLFYPNSKYDNLRNGMETIHTDDNHNQDVDYSSMNTKGPSTITQVAYKTTQARSEYTTRPIAYQKTSSISQSTNDAHSHEQLVQDDVEIASNMVFDDPESDMEFNEDQPDDVERPVEVDSSLVTASQIENDSEVHTSTIQTQGEVEICAEEDVMIIVPKPIVEDTNERRQLSMIP